MDSTIGPKGLSIPSVLEQAPTGAAESAGPIAGPAKYEGPQEAKPEIMIQAAQKQATERAAMQNLTGEMQKILLQSKVKSSDQTASRPTEKPSGPAAPATQPQTRTEKALNRAIDAFEEQSRKVKDLERELKSASWITRPTIEKSLAEEKKHLDALASKVEKLIQMRQTEKDIDKIYSDMNEKIIRNLQ